MFVVYIVYENENENLSVISDSLQPCGILQAGILEYAAFPFSKRSFQPRDQPQVSCIAGGFFTKHSVCIIYKKKKISNQKDSVLQWGYLFFLNGGKIHKI